MIGDVTLTHGISPMRGRPESVACSTVRSAKRRVREIYMGRDGWWYQITRNGKELWSSDHDLAGRSA